MAVATNRRVDLSFGWWLVAITLGVLGYLLAGCTTPYIRHTLLRAIFAVAVAGGATVAARSATYPFALALCAFSAGAAGVLVIGVGWSNLADSRERLRFTEILIPTAAAAFALTLSAAPWLTTPAGVIGAIVVASLNSTDPGGAVSRRLWAVPLWLGVTAGTLGFVGATNPQATWLGPVTSSGPSGAPRVALTFDDGPNGEATLAILRALDERGVKGTFFLVGKAVEREPEVANRIIADGHLAGNHSYSHDGWRFIQPAYPELTRGQTAFRSATGLCPHFYRPPHGTHTPFVALAAHRNDERIVNWDVSARDWLATDPADLARRIVEQSRPGSIILLHDGIDGIPGADRSVVIAALPAIIDGLRAKGLEPVRLDELLGERAYGEC